MNLVVENCTVVRRAGSPARTEDLAIEGNRVATRPPEGARRIDGTGLLATPGLVNTHHHLYQWLTRGDAPDHDLFSWLVALYPKWALVDDDMMHAAARAGIASLLTSGCTTTTDHHYIFPRSAGDLLAIEIDAARALGIRFHPCRGSMDLGRGAGGLPPDEIVEDRDAILDATEAAISKWHDPADDSMLKIAVAPCSPFSVTRELMVESAELARRAGVRLHTHLAETAEELQFCRERYGCRPAQYVRDLGWTGEDVWLAHCVQLSDADIQTLGATGVAHCPSSNARLGAGIAPIADLVAEYPRVGLGVDGPASNEGGELQGEMRAALLAARLRGGAGAMTAAGALALATSGGAQCLGRRWSLGTLEPGALADVALWRLDDLAHAGIEDPVAALVMGPTRRVHHLIVNGEVVVEDAELRTADEESLARDLDFQCRRLRERT